MLPIGVQSFEILRKDGYQYVDKSRYIYDLVHSGRQYFLSRPRRFGKSLLLSTLRAYWEGKKDLFEGLTIIDLETKNPAAWQMYPVFYFDFNGKNYYSASALEDVLDQHLRRWESIYGGDAFRSLEERFQNLIAAASENGKRCVVLVDEYDKPLLDVMNDPDLVEHNRSVFKGFFSVLKSCDEYLQFVFITGVTKFNKVSIFSDLNQLKDISINYKYAALCGITDEELANQFHMEVHAMAKSLNLTDEACHRSLRDMYDGYLFHPKGEKVYNPYSLFNALDDGEFRSYWFATGTPSFLVQQIKESRFDIQKFTDGMLYSDERSLSDYRIDNPDIVPLLYQTGYLTMIDYDQEKQRYTLGFPNEEVKYGFLESLVPAYAPESTAGTGKDIFTLEHCIEQGDLEGVRSILIALFASIPYSDPEKSPFEHYFETVIYLVFTLLGKYTKCEVHTSNGRADCIIETKSYIYIFEFKLNKSAEKALAQIEDKHYDLPYLADSRVLYKIGVNFDSETRNITGWKVNSRISPP